MTAHTSLQVLEDYIVGRFQAMASPCELLMENSDPSLAQQCLDMAHNEAARIERKFSRYRSDNIVYEINHGAGAPVTVDNETAALLDYAHQCHQISDGLFDITSGILRKAWHFDGEYGLPKQKTLDALLKHVGWEKVVWRNNAVTLPAGMEIDLGGIGKEYAVDRVTAMLRQHITFSVLVNFGGDLAITRPRNNDQGWLIGVADPRATGAQDKSAALHHYLLKQGAMATSGNAYRFIEHKGKRYGHVLNPRTGWPAVNSPASITVLANTCLEAGILSTLAMLYGRDAAEFLESQNAVYWCS